MDRLSENHFLIRQRPRRNDERHNESQEKSRDNLLYCYFTKILHDCERSA